MKTLPLLRAILFDLDGLFADTEPLQKVAFERTCRRYLGDGFALSEELWVTFVGKSDLENAKEVVEAFGMTVSPEGLIEERVEVYLETLRTTVVPAMPGIRDLLDAARSEGLKLAVGSSSTRPFVELSLERAFEAMAYPLPPSEVFDAIVCGDDPRISARKPAPDIYLQCARDLGVEPEECLVLEDSASGIESARRAGISRVIAIPNPYTVTHDFSRAYRMVNSALEILDVIHESLPTTIEGRKVR